MMDASAILDIKALSFSRQDRTSRFELHVPNLRLEAGGAVALTGPSGSGKSTLLDCLAFLNRPDGADRFIFRPRGEPEHDILLTQDQPDALAGLRARHLGYILQTGGLLPFASIRLNLELSRRMLGLTPGVGVEALAASLGILRHLDRLPRALSAGERQRAAVARALAHGPCLIIADEPTASLDPPNAEIVLRLLLQVVAAHGAALVVATHDWSLAERLGLPCLVSEIEATAGVTRSIFVPS